MTPLHLTVGNRIAQEKDFKNVTNKWIVMIVFIPSHWTEDTSDLFRVSSVKLPFTSPDTKFLNIIKQEANRIFLVSLDERQPERNCIPGCQ